MKLKWLVILSVLTVGCDKVDLDDIQNLNGNYIWILGHAGEGFQTGRHPVPANSETSIVKAIEYHNADGVEVDVQLSKDSVLILFHDELLDRATHCQGCVNENFSSYLLNCRFRRDFTVNTLQNEKLTTLENILQRYAGSVYNPRCFFLDLKLYDICGQNSDEYFDLFAYEISRLVSKYGIQETAFVSSSNSLLLRKIRALSPGVKLIYSIGAGDFEEGLQISLNNEFFGIEIYNDYITREQVLKAHAQNQWVIFYGVKDRNTQIDAVKKSPDAIITDNIPLLQQILAY